MKIGVVGYGNMGRKHAQIVKKVSNLAFICDTSYTTRHIAKRLHKIPTFMDYKDTLRTYPDAVIVATPPHTHYDIASFFIENEIPVLVEKPLTVNLMEASKLLEVASKKNVILQVGHIERFNPAVIEAKKYIENPVYIECERLSSRIAMPLIGCVLDLMIHDIDIVLYFFNYKKPLKVISFGANVFSPTEDIAKAIIEFEDGAAVLTTSRISIESKRSLRIFDEKRYLSVNYASKTLKVVERKSLKPVDRNLREKINIALSSFLKRNIETENFRVFYPPVDNLDALTLQITHFIDCVKSKKEPAAGVYEGYRAIELSIEIIKNMKTI